MEATEIEENVEIHPQDQDANRVFEEYIERKPSSLFVRFLITNRHLIGLLLGGGYAYLRHRRETNAKFSFSKDILLRLFLWLHWPLLKKKLIKQPFSVQLRRRLEMLGATYIKLGQIMSLREDMLPKDITDELKKLLDTLPAVKYDRFIELVEEQLKQPVHRIFTEVKQNPLGSASIAQTHRATLRTGEEVVLKLLKPGTRELIQTDSKIIKGMGAFLELFVPQLQPKNMFTEFCDYTNREVDFRLEADNAEEFAVNFIKHSEIHFPKIYREYSTSDVVCMQFFRGIKPDNRAYERYNEEERAKIVDYGAYAIIQMLYQDGFFHADLHPGNLMIMDGSNGPQVGFIDLGMVGRFEDSTRKTMLYYFNSLVMGDPQGAARYLTLLARKGKDSDIEGFRKEFIAIGNKWLKSPNFKEYSLAKLILESVALGSKYRMYYPLELVLMVKAIITYEGVGNVILPGFDIQKVTKKHIRRMVLSEVNPLDLLKTQMQNAPEILDIVSRSPLVLSEAFKRFETELVEKKKPIGMGLRNTILGGCCVIGGSILAASGLEWFVFTPILLLGFILALKS
ncbi:MAG TPA: AarF/UbiB family protein [Chitinophagales bacterium]|jgi:ubiquinone biosynthesis protein|nr:AarF/UbiB family protein [Chitinophagales bacterium]HQW79135.1 AarF/UbiB family protein [Chitinophagales bacterium]HRB67078.1 AarF/UbiB family protein [Chitinophagales bacterium]